MAAGAFCGAMYHDLDGTLLGLKGSLLADGAGRPSGAAVAALLACKEAGIELVPASGRRRDQNGELARLIGTRSFICEAGALLVVDGDRHWLGEFQPSGGQTVFEQIAETGVPLDLLREYAGRLEYHTPWHVGREASHLMRGLVDVAEVNGLLTRWGAPLKLVDNGVIREHNSQLGLEVVRAYHLTPLGASKAAAVARHRELRGYDREDTFAVGDSLLDLECAEVVGAFWLVANAAEEDPSLAAAVAARPNAVVASAGHGEGVREAVAAMIATRRWS
jgi:hydroxymethylpyrimidine pyrophosphatase-like HAD family hydrolase